MTPAESLCKLIRPNITLSNISSHTITKVFLPPKANFAARLTILLLASLVNLRFDGPKSVEVEKGEN